MPVVCSEFRAPWWLRNAHMQTLWQTLFRSRPVLPLQRERITLDDGDFLDLDWLGSGLHRPLVLILHGLEGSIESPYATGLMASLADAGLDSCFMHFRGCSGEPNRLDRSYHSGDTHDVAQVARYIEQRTGRSLYAAVGFSLGGNVLLKWLGESGPEAPVEKAVAISVPYRLADAAERMNHGFSRIYQYHLLSRLKRKYRDKFQSRKSPLNVDIDALRTFVEFDDQVTAALHGFSGAEDYYRRASSGQYLHNIKAHTLLIHALDDPFMYPGSVPPADALAPLVRLELSEHGGHVGFIHGQVPWRPRYWVDERIVRWLEADRTRRLVSC